VGKRREFVADILGPIVRQLDRHHGKTDPELLALCREGDGDAFAEVVRKYGPMVFRLCRRALSNTQDAEDAFQATFLVLVRKGYALDRPERLSNWLFGVAWKTSRKASDQRNRRRLREESSHAERRSAAPLEDPTAAEASARELQEALAEEIEGLSAKNREVLLFCALAGRTVDEAAAQLNCPSNTIKKRLARARELLENRLTKRRLLGAGSGLAALLAADTAGAAPPELVAATLKGIALWASGKTGTEAFSVRVVGLTNDILRAFVMSKFKRVAGVLAAVMLLLGSAGALYTWGAGHMQEPAVRVAADEPGKEPVKAEKNPESKDNFLTLLEKAEEFELLSLNPSIDPAQRDEKIKEDFHGFQVLGKTTVKDAQTRKKLVAAFKKGIKDSDGNAALCFNPRHGIRFTHDDKTVDFVICYECLQMRVYVGDKKEAEITTTNSPQDTFNSVLKNAKVRLPEK
jgi:RNA polymerase sigma factor (sigma-70 family)